MGRRQRAVQAAARQAQAAAGNDRHAHVRRRATIRPLAARRREWGSGGRKQESEAAPRGHRGEADEHGLARGDRIDQLEQHVRRDVRVRLRVACELSRRRRRGRPDGARPTFVCKATAVVGFESGRRNLPQRVQPGSAPADHAGFEHRTDGGGGCNAQVVAARQLAIPRRRQRLLECLVGLQSCSALDVDEASVLPAVERGRPRDGVSEAGATRKRGLALSLDASVAEAHGASVPPPARHRWQRWQARRQASPQGAARSKHATTLLPALSRSHAALLRVL